MTEDHIRTGRPRKNARRSSNSAMQSTQNENLEESEIIMDPSIDSPGNLSESQNSVDSTVSSPNKPEESSEICALCNCGSEMALILGQLTQYAVSASTLKKMDKIKIDTSKTHQEISSSDISKKDSKERVFFKRRRRKASDFDANLPPDMTTFGTAHLQDFSDILDSNQCIWAHHCCAAWSAGVCQTDSYDLENVDRAVGKALLKKCSHCQRYGASVECQVHRCNKLFHYPCCASAGAFQDITSMILLCPDHLDRTEKLADAEASCDGCGKTENLNLQLFCTSCGRHFHSYCVEMTIPITPVVRMGWQCSFCKVCQGCKQPGDEEKMLCCDHCDKGYHIYCLNPPISAVPKSLWKCVSCRKCDDCGSTRPGGGPSCRWHNNFTLCDRCYQQRKKGQCCPVCIRAVRLFGNTDVLQCSKCFKCVHGECDPDGLDADKYLCPECTGIGGNVPAIQDQNNDSVSSYDYDLAASGQKVLSIEEAELYSMPASADFMASINNNDHERFDLEEVDNYTDEKLSESTVDSPYSSLMSDSFTESTQNYYGRGRKKDDTSQRRFKKSFRGGRRFRKSRSYQTNYNGSHASMEEFTRNAVESLDSVSLSKLEIPVTAGGNEDDDGGEEGEEGLHSTVVIVSTRDSYTLKQDVCMCCGSFGKGKEGYLIGCVQCGQCFHPFCVNVKVNEVILKRGWRCLDCTVCEGCGRNADEGHLLLCDICDISFHIYCLSPPLEEVPVGGWKCQWCAICEDCGSKEPGFGCSWMANYTQCGPCSSIQYCSICTYAYEPNNLIIQCEKCNRWAHAECDGLYSEEDASLACSMTYHCVQCRPKTKHLGIYSNLKSSVISKLTIKRVLHGNALISNGFNRKTKTLHNLKARKLSKAALREQKRAELDALPLIPLDVSANECGTLSIDLLSLKNRVRMDELTKEKLHLTESGLKSIKSQVIRAPIHRAGVRKERISKKKEESKINIMSEEITCSVDSSDDTRLTPGERIETPFESDGLVGENEVLSPDLMSIKQEENMDLDLLHPDSTAETDELLLDDTNDDPSQGPDPEDMTDPFEFFGVNLLEKHLHMELESLGIPTKRKKLKKERKKERRLKKAKLAEAARLAFNLVKGPSVPDPTAVIIEQPIEVSISQTVEAPIPIQESPSVSMTDHMVKTLTAPSEQAKMDSVLQTSNSVTTTAQIPLLDTNDFPHVAGHEVEKLLADFNAGKIVPVDSLTKIKEELPSNTALNVPMFSHHPMDEVKKLAPSPIFPVKSPLLSATASSQDAFRTVFGDEIDMLKERPEFVTEKGDSGKIDTQKQLRKWELDEKLGENATISPVLYANVMHKNLIHDYKDWPNRARAIARLWRKLPADQREPFRLRARDNRVKSKDRSKKVAFKQLAEHTQRGQVNKPPTNVVKIKSPTSDQSAFGFQATRDVIKTDVNNPKIPHPTILTVPEPQKLSPLLQTLSPFSISSCSGVTPSPPRSPFFPNTPTTPNNESPSSNVDKSGKVGKKPKNKLSKQEKEENKLQKKLQMQNAFQEKEKQWKLLQQHRIFEQQRQAILKQSKAFAQDQHHYQPVHPSARFSATMTSSLSEDLQHAIVQKAAQSAFAPGKVPTPPSTERLAPGTPTATKDDGDKSKTFSPTLSIDKPTTPIPSTHTISSMIKDHPPHTFPYPGKDMKPELPVRNPALDLEAELRRANMEGLLSRPLDHNNPVRTAEQQQALLIHQQYMATQQQYIQWQLAQQQSSAIESLYGPQKPSSDKELPDVNSEEQHQERIRFLYHQRQFHKDSPMYVQQQLQQTPGKQPTTEVTTSPPQIAESPLPVSYPRPPHYPPGNVPDAMYHQMFMEYMMRYRKGQEIDQPTPPSSQLYNNMMTEIAKQYYQRHGSFGKLFPPPVPNTGPLPYPPRPGHSPYDERLFPSYAKGMPIPEIPKDAKLGNTSNFPSTLMPQKPVPNDGKTSFTKSRMSPSSSLPKSSSTLPKSASFQISRIAADSTSNDEYPNEIGVKAANPNQLSEVKTNNENEISSSKTSTSEEPGAADNENGLDPHRSTRGGNDEEVSSASTKELCSDGIHCGTDDEDETSNRKPVCSDGIHCGTDDEDETSNRKPVCSDGIHCGTDDEDETPNRKPVCSDGIHCGTDDEDETSNRKPVCSDGIHCGTDDEDETSNRKPVCSDGIHCGTDDEDETSTRKPMCSDGIHCGTDDEDETSNRKPVCSDGIHCGTDDEDETSNLKPVCSDGIHCGTDDEDETSTRKPMCSDGIHCGTDDEDETPNRKPVCSDGIHCGTDDEDETSNRKPVCSDGIHCGTDDEDETSNRKPVCSDGIHCGTDDEDETPNRKPVCSDGIHCGTDDEDETSNRKPVCSDGIHCGTDDEDETSNRKPVCSDGIHCGTDDEDETSTRKPMCSDGIHCGTDDEDETSNRKPVCSDGIHCGTDDEDETSNRKPVCSDGIHCGTDDEDETSTRKPMCSDGIHCGTDDEDETPNRKPVCSDGIHCGTDDEDETSNRKPVCSDGIHCGTDDEDETPNRKPVCSDGIHCGTDDEDETPNRKPVCSDGIHCGTDDEDETSNRKPVCSDGIHCGTDDEDETPNRKPVCSDGIHCGTDDEDETSNRKPVCSDGIHCGTDDEDETPNRKPVCSDGIHCGTDDEDETPNRKPVCSDGIHCGTDDEDETSNRKPVCSDGIHCGTDDEDETPNRKPVCSDGIHSGTDDEDETPNRKPVCSDGIHCGTDDEDETTKNKSNLVTEKGSNVKNEGLYFERSGVQAPIPLNSSTHITENKLHKEEFGRSQLASRAISPASVNTSVSNSQPSTSAPTIISPLPLLNNKDGIVKVNHIPADKIPSKFGFSSSFPAFPPMESQLDMKKPNNTLMNSNSGWPFPNLHGNLNADDKKVEGGQENSPDVRNKSSALGSNSPYDPTRSDGPILPSGITGAVPTSPFSPNSSTLQKGNIISLHPSSPRYHQIFIYQHQLLIMQFQQYQFQLQLQFQHLSQQQMSPQQQYLLQQQFHQQMMLLQQQFMQQQAQLHRMAANGIQFTEHQLNAMYQQQMLTQQAYRQWVMALPPEQQIHLQQRMQASMQQVQHQMAQIMQHARLEEEQKKKPVTKPRRMNKKKTTAITTAVDLTPPKFPVPELSEEMKAHTERNARTSATSAVSSIPTDTTNTSTSQVITKPKEGQVVPPKMPASVPANIMCSVQAPLPTNIPPSAPTSLPYSIAPTSVPHNVLTSIPPNIPTAIMPNMPTAILPNMATAIPPNMSTAIPPNMSPAIPPNMSPATPPNMSSNLPHNISPYISSNLPPNIPTHLQPSTGLSNHQVKKTEVITSSPDYLKEKNKVGEKHIGMSSGDSLVRKQQKDFELAQNEMKAMSAHQKAEQLLNPRMANPRPMFFPTHPSQLLHRAKFEGAGIRSPLHDKPPHSDSASYNPNATLPIGETPSFAARNSLNQMAAEVMRRKPGSQPFLPESAALAGSKDQSANPSVAATHTSFSVSNLLNKDKASDISGNLPHSSPDLMRQVLQQQQQQQQQRVTSAEEVNKYLGTPEHLAELEARKALQKAPKKKDKILEEKKRLKEIEREKKREEKERMRIIKEQKKVEKAQARMLKQKAIQDAKSTAIKKKQKMASLPIPDAPPEKPSSPAQTFTPKTPPMPVAPKIPLCEPDVHLVYPLVQPFGCSSSSSPSKISGAFGSGIITDVEDTYRDRPVTPSPLDTSNLHSTTDGNILHDTLFPSPERTYKDDNELSKATNIADSTSTATADGQDVSTMNEEVDCEQELAHENGNDEDMKVIPVGHCNQCYRALSRTVLYVDKKLEEVTEGVYDKFELSLSDQLAFCSNECVDTFQSKVKFDLENEDVELVDAVKTAAMVSLDESQQFSPLPIDDTRGDIFAPGMDSSKVNKHEQAVNQRWKRWVFQSNLTKKGRPKLEKEDLLELMSKYDVRLKPSESIKDKRCCIFCRTYGDGDSTQTSRLLNFNVDKWVHLNCALWSSEVYEALNGGLHNVEKAYGRGQYTRCSYCNRIGATVNCSQTFGAQQRLHCEKTFHFPCAVQLQCGFYKDKSMLCDHHKSSGLPGEELRTFSVRRKVYVERDVTKQLASMLGLNNDLERKEYTFRVGNLIFHELGHVPANLLENFSTKEYVYPINFETTSIFWDHEAVHSRRYYTCSISERFRAPRFKVKSHHNGTDRMQYTSCTAKGAWEEIVNNIKKQREHNGLLKVFPEFICGEDLFGLSEPAIQRMIESLPGIDTIPSYNFRFGRTPILIAELPLALNPTGCARTEKFRKHHLNRPLAMRTATDLTHKRSDSAVNDDNWLSYSQRTAHILSTKTGQYRRMRQDWRNCVVLGRSRIQGLGLFVKKSVEENTFIIEYIGSLIRNEVANRLEKTYERQNRGIYMFRIDNNVVVDATMTGGPARYINHSCDPNCVAEIVSIEGKKRIIIISNRKIEKGEELTYDYKFELEDDSSKIACLCGASNCRKWMN